MEARLSSPGHWRSAARKSIETTRCALLPSASDEHERWCESSSVIRANQRWETSRATSASTGRYSERRQCNPGAAMVKGEIGRTTGRAASNDDGKPRRRRKGEMSPHGWELVRRCHPAACGAIPARRDGGSSGMLPEMSGFLGAFGDAGKSRRPSEDEGKPCRRPSASVERSEQRRAGK